VEDIKKIHKEFQSKRVGAYETRYLKTLHRKHQNQTAVEIKKDVNIEDTFIKAFNNRRNSKSRTKTIPSQIGSNSKRPKVSSIKFQELQTLFNQFVRIIIIYFRMERGI
jgi:hypothetical protein